MKNLPRRIFLLFALLLIFNSDAFASLMACTNPHGPGFVICELSLENKIRLSLFEAKLVLMGSFKTVHNSLDRGRFKTFRFEIDKFYKGSIPVKSIIISLPTYVPLSKVSSESSVDLDKDSIAEYSRSTQLLERELEKYNIDRRTFREELEKKRLKIMGSPNYSVDMLPIVHVTGGSRRDTDVPVEVGKKYILILYGNVLRYQPEWTNLSRIGSSSYTLFTNQLDLYPAEKQKLIEDILPISEGLISKGLMPPNPNYTPFVAPVEVPADVPAEVLEYAATLEKLQEQSIRRPIEPLFSLGVRINRAMTSLTVRDSLLANLSDDDFNFIKDQMKGFKINRGEVTVATSDNAFFLALSKEKGMDVDIAFFNLHSLTMSDRGVAKYFEKSPKYNHCIKHGKGLLVDFYGKWRDFKESYPSAYPFFDLWTIGQVKGNLTYGANTCGSPSDVIKEQKLFIKAYPDSELSERLKQRTENIRTYSEGEMAKRKYPELYQEEDKK